MGIQEVGRGSTPQPSLVDLDKRRQLIEEYFKNPSDSLLNEIVKRLPSASLKDQISADLKDYRDLSETISKVCDHFFMNER